MQHAEYGLRRSGRFLSTTLCESDPSAHSVRPDRRGERKSPPAHRRQAQNSGAEARSCGVQSPLSSFAKPPPPAVLFRLSPRDLCRKGCDRLGQRIAPCQTRGAKQLWPKRDHSLWTQLNFGHFIEGHCQAAALATAIDHEKVTMRSIAFP